MSYNNLKKTNSNALYFEALRDAKLCVRHCNGEARVSSYGNYDTSNNMMISKQRDEATSIAAMIQC